MTSAVVIPFNEQLRINYLDNEYKKLAKKADKELTKACTKYKNQHFRLRTGLATVFPAGKLEFNNIIAAVPPITNNESAAQLLKKVILSILDIMLDHEFKSIIIPTLCTKDSEIPEEEYIAILLKTLKEYFDENEQEMKGKRIGFKTLPLPEINEQLDSLVKQYSKKVRKARKASTQEEYKYKESSKDKKYYQDPREETKDEKIEAGNYDSPIPSKQIQKLENHIISLEEENKELKEQVSSLNEKLNQLEDIKNSKLEKSLNETPRDHMDQEDLDQESKGDISSKSIFKKKDNSAIETNEDEDLQKENIELQQNFKELEDKYLKLKAKKKQMKIKNKELENKNTKLEEKVEKDIEEYNNLVLRYEKYKKRYLAYKSKEESKGIPKVPRKASRDHSHPPKMKSKDEINKLKAANLQKSTLP